MSTTPNKTAEAVERQDLEALIAELEARANARHSGEASPTARLCARAAQALSTAQQSEARVREALEVLIRHFEGDELHDEGAFDPACADCLALDEARKVLASLTAPKPEEGETATPWTCAHITEGGKCLFAERDWSPAAKPTRCAGCPDAPKPEAASPAPSRVEPVAWVCSQDLPALKDPSAAIVARGSKGGSFDTPLYTSPPDAQPRIEALEKENEDLKLRLAVADQAFMKFQGGFPLDRSTGASRLLNEAARIIREVTGADYKRRNEQADDYRAAWSARAALKAEEKG